MSKLKPGLIIPDVHIPYHDERAWRLMLKAARALRPKWIVVLGDFGDFYAVSSFAKDPLRASQLDVEVAACNEKLDELDSLGAKEKHFIAGNHCHRLERYLQEKAPELFTMLKVEQLFRLSQRRWTYTPYRDHFRLGKVYFTHDTGSSTGRTAAYKAMDTYQHSIVTGHTHRLAYVVEGNAVGNSLVSAQFGWLGDVERVDYQHRIKAEKDYALGFGVGYLRDNGFIYLQPVPIVDYSCVVSGQLFRV
jgi:predicted phosphodiesterase